MWWTVLWAADASPSSQVAWSHGATTVCLHLLFFASKQTPNGCCSSLTLESVVFTRVEKCYLVKNRESKVLLIYSECDCFFLVEDSV